MLWTLDSPFYPSLQLPVPKSYCDLCGQFPLYFPTGLLFQTFPKTLTPSTLLLSTPPSHMTYRDFKYNKENQFLK